MKILILGLNYAPEKVGIAVYTTGLAESLTVSGHQVRVVAGQPYYPSWSIEAGYSKFWYTRGTEQGVDVIRAPHYVPKNPTGLKRLIHHAAFAASTIIPLITHALRWHPDLIITIAPSLIAAPNALIAAKITGAHSWLHIQDFEVEAAFATGLLTSTHVLGRLAKRFEKFVLRSFDKVSTISPQMHEKLLQKGVETHRAFEFRNWANTETIVPLDQTSSYRSEWDIQTPHVALYSGNIANKQGIEIVVKAASLLRDREDLTFVVCGEGPNKDELIRSAHHLKNIKFYDLQPKERLNELLGLATIHLLPQLAGAADLVLPSKLANMLASGRPVVATAAPDTGLAKEVEGCGLVTPPGDEKRFAESIEHLMDDSDLWSSSAVAARNRAERKWSRSSIFLKLDLALQDYNERTAEV